MADLLAIVQVIFIVLATVVAVYIVRVVERLMALRASSSTRSRSIRPSYGPGYGLLGWEISDE